MSNPAPATLPLPAPRTLRRRSSRAQLRLVLGIEATVDGETVRALRQVTPRGVLGVSDDAVAQCIALLIASAQEAQS